MNVSTSVARGDGELLREFVERRAEGAFAEVVRRHGGMVLAVCRSVLGHTPDAEDAAQAVFLTLARTAHRSAVQRHLVGWLHRVAWYVAARGAEARAIRRRHEQEAARMKREMPSPEAEPIEGERLHRVLAKLPEKYSVALILHHMEGRSHAETAALLGCSVDAVAVRLHRGREMLRKRLDERGLAAIAGVGAPMSAAFVALAAKAAAASVSGGMMTALVPGPTVALANAAVKMLFWSGVKGTAKVAVVALLVGGAAGAVLVSRGAGGRAPEMRVAASQAALPAGAITGQITQIGNGGIAIHRQDGQTITMPLDAATRVTVDGKAATVADLKVGMDAGAVLTAGRPAVEVRAQTRGVAPAQ